MKFQIKTIESKEKTHKNKKNETTIDVYAFDPERITDLDLINREKCNYKFKISKIAAIGIIALCLPITAFASEINVWNIVRLTNLERSRNSVAQLKISSELNIAASHKAQDMVNNQYFEHYSPLNVTPWDFIKNAGYEYKYAGENLAIDFQTSEGVTNAWMKSGSHRKNILNNNYEDIGVGVLKGQLNGHETTIVVQMFGKEEKKNSKLEFLNQISSMLGIRN